jgi:hypothetical protein
MPVHPQSPMVTRTTTGLPPVPENVNPFEYWQLLANVYFNFPPGLGVRLIVLLCLVG